MVENEKQQNVLIRVFKAKLKWIDKKSAPSVGQKIVQELEAIISNQTVRRHLHEIRFYELVASRRPYVNKANRIKRLNYAEMYENKDMDFWKRPMNRNLTCLELMERSWCGVYPKK